ncbi:MAG TPA: class I SAM-dependent methyltransferase [Solirubrobacteraceae bacterium]|nr:class I SAM-dependent methyltransferase [Solirubrobacteraceae bacterium]
MDIFADSLWQMSFGERAALEGVLSQLRPALSIEIGTAEGGSLERIAAYSDEVHSFDLVPPQLSVAEAEHVTIHSGDSHETLPRELGRLAEDGRSVDFVLVDGDHSSDGVRRDIEDLLNSSAVSSTVILIHDTTNPVVRAGLDAVHYTAWPKVAHVDLDFVPGYMFREERLLHELWGGLGLLLVDSLRLAYNAASVPQERYYPAAALFASIRDRVITREFGPGSLEVERLAPDLTVNEKLDRHIAELEAEILRITSVSAHHEALWRDIMNSVSWKVTAPLRGLAAQGRARVRS